MLVSVAYRQLPGAHRATSVAAAVLAAVLNRFGR
jgi:hypothetical protein